ncbi:MAG: sulfatase [Cyclobacteriaceae bacterium]
MTLNYFHLFWSSAFLFIIGFGCKPDQSKKELRTRPNILFIMSDDHAVNAVGAYSKRLAEFARTPNIDQLAEEGMLFENCFVTNSICSPSRATFLTGKYSHKNGVYCLNQNFEEQPTSATMMQQAGYRTGVFGKWHLKSAPRGFDDYKVLQKQGRYENPEFVEKGREELIEHAGWVDDVITEMTQQFILDGENSDQPFFVMCQYKSAHDPWSSRSPFDTAYQNIKIPEPDNLCDNYQNRSDAARETTLKLEMMDQRTFAHDRLATEDTCEQRQHIYQQYIKAYLRSAQVMDDNVGKLMQFLEENDLAENTIVIYTSDQGHFLGEHGFFSKRFIYEESMQMPLIVRYPGVIEAGSRRPELITNLDFAPTILGLAGAPIPEDIQGDSFAELFHGNDIDGWRDASYYRDWQHLLHRRVAAHYGIRTADHKLIFYYGLPLGQTDFEATPPEWEMFDLKNDPQEMQNIYNDPTNAETIAQLKEQLLELKQQYDDTDDQYPEMQQVHQEYY